MRINNFHKTEKSFTKVKVLCIHTLFVHGFFFNLIYYLLAIEKYSNLILLLSNSILIFIKFDTTVF